MVIRLGLIGLGRIARQSHIPALLRSPRFKLIAGADPAQPSALGIPVFADCETLLDRMGGQIDAVSICTPPQFHTSIARKCIMAGLHVLLEKPPAASLGEIESLLEVARPGRATLCFSWHSRMNKAVSLAAAFLRDRAPWTFEAIWEEDPDIWHEGQDWIWQPGGLGVFDAGINAFSVLTSLSPARWLVESAQLHYLGDKQAPCAAVVRLASSCGNSGTVRMKWAPRLQDRHEIIISTRRGELNLAEGATVLAGALQHSGEKVEEYDRLYDYFGDLIERKESDLDYQPMRIVSDAFLLGSRLAG